MPSDILRIEEMFRRCSLQSRRLRFFRPVPSAPYGYLEEVLADPETHHAFLIEQDGEPIGLAELHLIGPLSGSLALIIEDQYQRKGVGTLALRMLLCRARELGLRVLEADLLFENSAVLRAMRRVGPASVSWEDDIFHVELDLASADLADDCKAESRLRSG
jgi:RimJ/RimL family protein N-acetyltransferase